MRFRPRSSYKRMPWKNGLGVTEEIEIFPPAADFAKGAFGWRLSSATVSADGPFSNFPGCDRLLAIVSGEGLKLNEEKLAGDQVARFPGEKAIEGRLLSGPVVDLGLIYKRDEFIAMMEFREFGPGTHALPYAGVKNFIVVCSGELRAGGHSLSALDSLEIDGTGEIVVDGEAEIFLVEITPIK